MEYYEGKDKEYALNFPIRKSFSIFTCLFPDKALFLKEKLGGVEGMLSIHKGRSSFPINPIVSTAHHFLFTSEGKRVEPIVVRGGGRLRRLHTFQWIVEPGKYFHLEYQKYIRGIRIEEICIDDEGKEKLMTRHNVTGIPIGVFIELIHCYFNNISNDE